MPFWFIPALFGGGGAAAGGAAAGGAMAGGAMAGGAMAGGAMAGGAMAGGAMGAGGLFAGGAMGAGGWLGGGMAAGAAGGGFSQMAPAMLGMGMNAIQAMGGSSGGGFAPQFEVPLSPEGEKLKTSLYEKTKKQWEEGLLPENLASIYMGKVKREEAKTRRASRGMLTSMAGGRTRGGMGIMATLTESERMMQGATGPAEWKVGQREEELRNAMAMMQNIRNIEMQTPLLRAQAQMYKDIMSQGRRATQGQALGNMAQWAAMMAAYR